MIEVNYGDWVIECDPERTRQIYASLGPTGPLECTCLHCKNFQAARSRVYPTDVLDLFARMGIEPLIENEVYEMGALEPGVHLYGGWLHLVGKILARPADERACGDKAASLVPRQIEDCTPFKLQFSEGRDCIREAFVDEQVVQADFTAAVPWVLDEAPT